MSEQLPVPADFAAPINGQPDLLFIAGEHSGDEHAAQIVADIRLNPRLNHRQQIRGISPQKSGFPVTHQKIFQRRIADGSPDFVAIKLLR